MRRSDVLRCCTGAAAGGWGWRRGLLDGGHEGGLWRGVRREPAVGTISRASEHITRILPFQTPYKMLSSQHELSEACHRGTGRACAGDRVQRLGARAGAGECADGLARENRCGIRGASRGGGRGASGRSNARAWCVARVVRNRSAAASADASCEVFTGCEPPGGRDLDRQTRVAVSNAGPAAGAFALRRSPLCRQPRVGDRSCSSQHCDRRRHRRWVSPGDVADASSSACRRGRRREWRRERRRRRRGGRHAHPRPPARRAQGALRRRHALARHAITVTKRPPALAARAAACEGAWHY